MKLKKKHFEFAETISHFVDRNYYPDFVEPTREQIDIFTQIESIGNSHLSEDQIKLVEPMLNGKTQYDLQISMIYDELKEWIHNGWGWYPVIDSIMTHTILETPQLKTYISFLETLKGKLETKGGFNTLIDYYKNR